MYPYHNQIKKRIQNQELISYEFVEKYKQISPCLLLHFNTPPYTKPIRVHRFDMYIPILEKYFGTTITLDTKAP